MRRGRPPYPDLLTPREQEVLELLREGLTNQQIADRLGIGVYGARYHVSEILSKLGVSSREEAAAWRGELAPTGRRRFGLASLSAALRQGSLEGLMRASSLAAIGAGVAVLTLLAVGLIILASRSDGPAAVPLGKVAYVIEGNIWVRELPDGAPIQITDSGSDLAPEWSASGEWLSFYREPPPPGAGGLWVVRADGTDARLIGGVPFAWSPVDDRFVYSEDGSLVVETADAAARHVLVPRTDDVDASGYQRWSPDGEWISFTNGLGRIPGSQFRDPLYNLTYRIRADGGEPIEIYRRLAHIWDSEPKDQLSVDVRQHGWSADGSVYLLSESVVPALDYEAAMDEGRQADDGFHLLTVSMADGSVTGTGIYSRAFTLPRSPVDNAVLVNAGIDLRNWFDRSVAVFDPLTSSLAYLTGPEIAALDPSWSPDGALIAYASAPAVPGTDWGDPEAVSAFNQRHIWVMERDGRGKQQVTTDSRYRDEQPLWTPDDNHILFARIDLTEPGTTISLWLLDLRSGDTELVADDIFTSLDRLEGRAYDIRSDPEPLWGQLFSYWRP